MDNYRIIDETELFKLISIYEEAYLVNKLTQEKTFLGDFYGDPSCGLISYNNDFCFVGGQDECVLFVYGNIISICDEKLAFPFDVKQNKVSTILVLTDPWCDKSAIWEINIGTLIITKIRNFMDYKNKKYTESVIW